MAHSGAVIVRLRRAPCAMGRLPTRPARRAPEAAPPVSRLALILPRGALRRHNDCSSGIAMFRLVLVVLCALICVGAQPAAAQTPPAGPLQILPRSEER